MLQKQSLCITFPAFLVNQSKTALQHQISKLVLGPFFAKITDRPQNEMARQLTPEKLDELEIEISHRSIHLSLLL